jgi:hypothetical protein
MSLPPILQSAQIAAICRRFGVSRLEVFGSAGTAQFVAGSSDYDLIASFKPHSSTSLGARFVGLADALEAALGAPVDLMTDQPVANPYLRAEIEATRRLVYDESAAEASV